MKLLNAHPEASRILSDLFEVGKEAAWSTPWVPAPPTLDDVLGAMRTARQLLVDYLRFQWDSLQRAVESSAGRS